MSDERRGPGKSWVTTEIGTLEIGRSIFVPLSEFKTEVSARNSVSRRGKALGFKLTTIKGEDGYTVKRMA